MKGAEQFFSAKLVYFHLKLLNTWNVNRKPNSISYITEAVQSKYFYNTFTSSSSFLFQLLVNQVKTSFCKPMHREAISSWAAGYQPHNSHSAPLATWLPRQNSLSKSLICLGDLHSGGQPTFELALPKHTYKTGKKNQTEILSRLADRVPYIWAILLTIFYVLLL